MVFGLMVVERWRLEVAASKTSLCPCENHTSAMFGCCAMFNNFFEHKVCERDTLWLVAISSISAAADPTHRYINAFPFFGSLHLLFKGQYITVNDELLGRNEEELDR